MDHRRALLLLLCGLALMILALLNLQPEPEPAFVSYDWEPRLVVVPPQPEPEPPPREPMVWPEGGGIVGTVRLVGKSRAHGVWVYDEGEGPPVIDRPQADVVIAGLQFNPRDAAVGPGGRVQFINKDHEFHQPFSVTRGVEFNLHPPFRNGELRAQTFESPGLVDVFCHRHEDMAMTVLVLPNAWYARTDRDGRFAIPDVAPGNRKVTAWIDGYHPVTLDVQVPEEAVATIHFDLELAPPYRRPLVDR